MSYSSVLHLVFVFAICHRYCFALLLSSPLQASTMRQLSLPPPLSLPSSKYRTTEIFTLSPRFPLHSTPPRDKHLHSIRHRIPRKKQRDSVSLIRAPILMQLTRNRMPSTASQGDIASPLFPQPFILWPIEAGFLRVKGQGRLGSR